MNYSAIPVKQNHLNKTITQMKDKCDEMRLFGIYLIFIFISSVIFNSLVIWIFYVKKESRTALNKLFVTLTILNLFGCIIEIPLVIFSSFNCR